MLCAIRQLGWMVPLLAMLLVGCGDRDRLLMQQLEELKREMAQLKANATNTAVVMDDVQNKLLLLEDQVESNRLLLARAPAPEPVLPVVKLSPSRELAAAPSPAPAERGGYSVETVPEISFQQLNDSGLVVEMSGARDRAPAPAPAPARAKKRRFDSRPIELYKHAFELLKQKQHYEAVAEFDHFLEQYPNHDYSDNALYWMGEAYYDLQDYQRAITCFQKVVTLYPNGNKVPDALLKVGLCHANAGNREAARQVMAQLVTRYPSTRAAGIAQKKMQAP